MLGLLLLTGSACAQTRIHRGPSGWQCTPIGPATCRPKTPPPVRNPPPPPPVFLPGPDPRTDDCLGQVAELKKQLAELRQLVAELRERLDQPAHFELSEESRQQLRAEAAAAARAELHIHTQHTPHHGPPPKAAAYYQIVPRLD